MKHNGSIEWDKKFSREIDKKCENNVEFDNKASWGSDNQ
jgi:hypothetical protein